MSEQHPWPVEPRLGLVDWLEMEHRPDRGILPTRYVSIVEFIPRFCTHRAGEERLTPWLQAECETEVRRALCDGKLVGWQIADSGALSKVEATSWVSHFVWHRAKTAQDMPKPDGDYDGFDVPEDEWRALLREARAAGRYVLECGEVLQWLGIAPAPGVAGAVGSSSEIRNNEFERLVAALRLHFGFDKPGASWIKEDVVIDEIRDILRVHGLKDFHTEVQRIADAVRPTAHKRRGNRSNEEREEMEAWRQRMAESRSKFEFDRDETARES